jgi:cell division protein FtsI (penicillin-binding protein 3)
VGGPAPIAETVKKTRADSGFVVVMDVKTGQVLALAQAPSMDSRRGRRRRR